MTIMKNKQPPLFQTYGFSMLLIASLMVGAALGLIFRQEATVFKPLGDIFLNLLFTLIIPLVFFSIASTVAGMTDLKRLGKILSVMVLIFVVTGLLASTLMIVAVMFFPPASGVKGWFRKK